MPRNLLHYKIMNVTVKNHFCGFNVVKWLMESLDGNGIACNKLMTDCCAREAAGWPVMRGKPDERSGYLI